MAFTEISIYKVPKMMVQEIQKMSKVIKHDELSTCCVVIGVFNISIKIKHIV